MEDSTSRDFSNATLREFDAVYSIKAQDEAYDKAHDQVTIKIIEFCSKEKNIFEIMEYLGYKNRTRFRRDYIKPLVEKGLLKMTIPDKPTSKN